MNGPASTSDSGSQAARLTGFLARNRPSIVVWLAVLISTAGIRMVSPLLPKFAEDVGAPRFG